MLMALFTGSWREACRARVPPGSVAVDFRTDPDDNPSDNDGNAVAEGVAADEDAESVEDFKNEDAGGNAGSTEDNSDGFR